MDTVLFTEFCGLRFFKTIFSTDEKVIFTDYIKLNFSIFRTKFGFVGNHFRRIKLKTKKIFQTNWMLTFLMALGCCFVMNISYTFAQREQLVYERLSVEQGLSFNGVTDIIQDKKGFMWFATADGLNRFDGYDFKVFKLNPNDTNSLASPYVNSLFVDSYGTIWINAVGFLHCYDEIEGTLHRLLTGTWLTGMCEDSSNPSNQGMWFTTLGGGLYWWNRMEKKFIHYHYDNHNLNSLNSDSLLCVSVDKSGSLWIGGFDGLNSMDILRKHFKSYLNGPSSPVYDICFDPSPDKDVVWIATGNGLFMYDKKSNIFEKFENPFMNHKNQYDNDVRNLYFDSKGTLWVGMIGGIAGFDVNARRYFTYYNEFQTFPWGHITKTWLIQEDAKGTVWALAHGAGPTSHPLLRFNNEKKEFEPFPKSPGSALYAYSMFIDKSGTMWLGTEDNGILKVDENRKPFYNYLVSTAGDNEETIISGIAEDKSGDIWLGSNNGLYRFNPQTESFQHFKNNPDDPTTLSANSIGPVISDHNGNIWMGANGLDFYDKKRNVFQHFRHNPADSNSISSDYITSIFESSNGTIWIGTYDGVLEEHHAGQNLFKHHYPDYSATFDHIALSGLVENPAGTVWFTVRGAGLLSYNISDNIFNRYQDAPKPFSPPTTLSSLSLLTLYADRKGNFWIGADACVVKYDKLSGEFLAITEQDGLANQHVNSILEDNEGYMWFGTAKGLSKYSPSSKEVWNYDVNDGLKIGDVTISAGCKARSGELYFGGGHGFVRFYPDRIKANSFLPPIVITSFKKFNEYATLDTSISEKKLISLHYYENNISFEFTALNYTASHKNQYAYKMEGIDKDWVYSGTRRYASYPDLSPGKYTFRVKGSNNDGVWNEAGTSISIIITPPWWKTWWAYSFYALIFIFSLYWIRRYELNRLRLKDQVKMDEAVLKEREETDKMKSRFFANISHEFRTPLTLILGPAEKISSKTSDNVVKDANIIKRNSRRLLQLINQLLDLSKLESGKLKVEASKGNIVSFVKGAALSFESLAESKDISLKINSEKEFIEMYFDKEKMMKILTNILSNAFKFTPEEGEITVSVSEKSHAELVSASPEIPKQVRDDKGKDFVEIKIRDTGIGIAQEEIPKLFNRFYRVDSSHTREYEGTGIGLALTKELVELHHGKINVESAKAVDRKGIKGWTEFTLEFPLGRDHLKDEEICEEKETKTNVIPSEARNLNVSDKDKNQIESILIDSSSITPENDIEANEDKTIILVVEDNFDMRTYIKESFNSDYIVEEAINGEQGVRKAEKIIPDLIVSDMMMPKMDGNELVRILKNDEKTSHIPIILLTARAGYEDKLEGLETGVDDYLTKPFDIKELQIRVKNLINIRKKLQEKFSKIEFKPVKEKKLNSLDEKFMNRVNEIIEEHIAEEEFNMEEFGEELFMSRMQVYRKLKALTGKSANRYVRTFKLQKARQMIEEKQGTISEIAYSLGFGSPAYFTKCFKDEFGYPPREIKE